MLELMILHPYFCSLTLFVLLAALPPAQIENEQRKVKHIKPVTVMITNPSIPFPSYLSLTTNKTPP